MAEDNRAARPGVPIPNHAGKPKLTVWAGILLILATSLIHFIDAPDAFREMPCPGTSIIACASVAAVGLKAAQAFLSDGADDVRELPLYLSPESERCGSG